MVHRCNLRTTAKVLLKLEEKSHLVSCLGLLNLDTLQLLLIIRAHITASTQLVPCILHLENTELSPAIKAIKFFKECRSATYSQVCYMIAKYYK